MITETDIRSALTSLDDANGEIYPALSNQATAENTVRAAKAELDDAKRRLEDAVTQATATAMFGNPPVVDGKNAEARKAQLDAYLLDAPGVFHARQQVEIAKSALLDAETMAEQLKADARIALARVGLAQHSAALIAAYCTFLACPASEAVTADVGW